MLELTTHCAEDHMFNTTRGCMFVLHLKGVGKVMQEKIKMRKEESQNANKSRIRISLRKRGEGTC